MCHGQYAPGVNIPKCFLILSVVSSIFPTHLPWRPWQKTDLNSCTVWCNLFFIKLERSSSGMFKDKIRLNFYKAGPAACLKAAEMILFKSSKDSCSRLPGNGLLWPGKLCLSAISEEGWRFWLRTWKTTVHISLLTFFKPSPPSFLILNYILQRGFPIFSFTSKYLGIYEKFNKKFVFCFTPERAAWNLINCLQWCQSRLKTTRLKMKTKGVNFPDLCRLHVRLHTCLRLEAQGYASRF